MAEQGTINRLVLGVAGLIIITVVVFVIVSTILDTEILGDTIRSYSVNVLAENGSTGDDESTAFLNETGYTLGEGGTAVTANGTRSGFILNAIVNRNNYTAEINYTIEPGNYSFDANNGTLVNDTGEWQNVSISYTFTYTTPANTFAHTGFQNTAAGMGTNLTAGVDEVAEKVPTILLIATVVLLFAVLVILIARSREMGIGGGEASSL